MENLTLDQAELIFSLFVAQNADRKISELSIIRNVDEFICLSYGNWNWFSYIPSNFYVWEMTSTFVGEWASFDIMKHISLEDKV